MSDVSTTPEPVVPVAGIRISKVRIQNFRCIDEIELDLEPGTTYLVGENNSGKTSILYALWSALGSRRPLDDDLRRTPEGALVEDASVDIWIVPSGTSDSFSPELTRQLERMQPDPSTGISTVGIRTVFRSSQESSILLTQRFFLQPNNEGNWVSAEDPPFRSSLMDLIEAQFLDTSRDLVDELGNRTSVWGRVLTDLQIEQNTKTGETRDDLENALNDIAQRIRNASPVLSSLEKDLDGIAEVQASVGRVEIQPVPPRLEELARTVEVVHHQDRQPILPLRFLGLGSRSLATLLVFRTLVQFRLGADSGLKPHLLTLLEEPEAHLHPQAISVLQSLLDRLPGQRVVSTHSPQLVVHTDPRSVRIIRRSPEEIRVIDLTPNIAKRVAQFRKYVERPFGEILFARAIVFGDGSTERCTLPALLSGYFGCHPGGLGISFFDCESMDQDQTNIVVHAAHDLKIKWLVFVDNDLSGSKALNRIKRPSAEGLTGEVLTMESDEVIVSGNKQIEQLLVDADYLEEIEEVASENDLELVTNQKGYLKFLKDNKPWAAEQVAIKAVKNNRLLPSSIIELGQRLAESLDVASYTNQARSIQ